MARREAIPTEARGDPDRGERKVHLQFQLRPRWRCRELRLPEKA